VGAYIIRVLHDRTESEKDVATAAEADACLALEYRAGTLAFDRQRDDCHQRQGEYNEGASDCDIAVTPDLIAVPETLSHRRRVAMLDRDGSWHCQPVINGWGATAFLKS
jgi:hypothetical protein